MIEALMAGKLVGKLVGKPEPRTSRGGAAYVLARLRVPSGADEVHFVRLTAFSDTACAALLALDDGDAVAVAGTLKAGAWVDRDGAARPNLDMVAAQVVTVYHLQRRRQAIQPSTGAIAAEATSASPGRRGCASRGQAPAPSPEPSAEAAAAFGASSDDAWLAGSAGERTP